MTPRHSRVVGRAVGSSIATLALLLISACSPGDADAPEVIEDRSIPDSAPEVHALTAGPSQVWGSGRALTAQALPDGGVAVVTTTGVYLETPEGKTTALDHFGSPVEVGSSALSPDASLLAVATVFPSGIRIYDLVAGTHIASYELSPDAAVRTLEFEPQSGRFVADTAVGPFTSPDPRAADLQPLVAEPTFSVSAVLSGGTVVTPITGTMDIAISRIDGAERRTLPLPDGATARDAKAAPSVGVIGVSVAVGQEDAFERSDQIMLFDSTTFEQRGVIDAGTALDPTQWAVTDDEVVIAAGSTLAAWSFDGAPVGTPVPIDSPVASLRPVAGGLVSVHTDGSVLRWTTVASGAAVINSGGTSVRDVTLSTDDALVTIVDYFGAVRSSMTADGTQVSSVDRFAAAETTGVAISIDGTKVGVSASSGRVAVLDDALVERWTVQAGETPEHVGAVSFDPASGAIATGLAERAGDTAFDDTVTVWDEEQQSPRFSVGGEKEEIAGCSFFYSRIRYSNDATMMAVTSHDFSVLVLDVATGQVQHELPGTTTILDLAFSPDDDLLIATYDDGTVNVWQTSDFALGATYKAAPGGYLAIAVMPDSATMAVTDVTGSIALVDLMTGAPLRTFADATFRTSTLALSSDGALVAAPTADAGIGIWSTASGTRVAALAGHTGTVTGLAFSPQGDWLASSSSDGTARTWTLDRVN
jgi:WD40 repeat protein